MVTVAWGMLDKSLVDNEKIEEAIARLILEHGQDETSHLGVGESLQSHKASVIIDHLINSVVTDKILNLAVTTDKINTLAVTTEKLNSLAVTEAKIANLAVTEAKINSLAVTQAKIANLAVTEAKINSLAVTQAKIANLAVTDAKINDLTVEKLTGTYLTGKFVRTAASGKRVEMRNSNNDVAFYDSNGSLGGTILGQSGKIYVSGSGLNIECPLTMEDELIIDTTRSVIPTTNNTYDLGTSSYKWKDLYLSGKLKLNLSVPNLTGDLIPDANSYNDLGFTNYKWYRVFRTNEVACDLPTNNSAIDVFKKIKSPKIHKGDYGERHYFKDTDFPDELKLTPDPKKGGNVEIEMTRTLGVSVQAIRELIEKVETIETKFK